MLPTRQHLERFAIRGLVPGKTTVAKTHGVLVTFQQWMKEELTTGSELLEWWSAWWYCPATKTAGYLESGCAMDASLFGAAVRIQCRKKQESQDARDSEMPNEKAPDTKQWQWDVVQTTPEDHKRRKEKLKYWKSNLKSP